MTAANDLIPNIPKLEIVKLPPFIFKFLLGEGILTKLNMNRLLYLKFMGLKFVGASLLGQGIHV
jgi:hypothetical protein